MKKPIQISIPTPCHENWDAMTPADNDRFCTSCQKTVFDFTNSSDREIASVLKNTNNACGRFRATQLDRDLVVPKEKSTIWMAASAAVVSFLTIGNHTISAQTPVNTEQHVSETDDIKVGKVAAPQTITITGVVLDENKKPFGGVNILIEGTTTGVQTDLEGHYTIYSKFGDRLTFSYIGYNPITINVTNSKIINVTMDIDDIELLGEVVYVKDRSFFGRVFHSIGNIFR
ncbi:carboxypeptidase-like regulatory domain-containing protein [Flavobacterium suzhouense]|uniref:Carboxypeptidase-like regulatory domain-containing protein n=1 Tax=Flavobacterium suzhouense TaxID=1529638 RepID=A0ABW5NXK3_9FLAO